MLFYNKTNALFFNHSTSMKTSFCTVMALYNLIKLNILRKIKSSSYLTSMENVCCIIILELFFYKKKHSGSCQVYAKLYISH